MPAPVDREGSELKPAINSAAYFIISFAGLALRARRHGAACAMRVCEQFRVAGRMSFTLLGSAVIPLWLWLLLALVFAVAGHIRAIA